MNKYELETLMGIKVLRRLCEVKVSAWVRRNTDKALCVCVSRMVEWNPCQCLESLSSLLSWINGKVTVCTGAHTHTHTGRFTHVSALLCPSTMTGTLSHPIPPSHEDTQTRLVVSLSTRKHTTLWAATPSPRHLAFLTNYPEMSDLGDLSLSTLKLKYCLSNFLFFF